MVMGLLLTFSGCFLYWLLKPPMEQISTREEVDFLEKPSVDLDMSLSVH
jgi:hypothetical protein